MHLDAAFESVSARVSITREAFDAMAAQCEQHPINVDGKPAGVIFVKGSEIHACVSSWAHGRWFDRRAARVLNEVIEIHGKATTKATTKAGVEFVQRLGFVRVGDGWERNEKWALKR